MKTVTRRGLLDMQVCVPKDMSDKDVMNFANLENLCGCSNGWQIRKQGDKLLGDDNERVQCSNNIDNVHITLDAQKGDNIL